MTDTNQSNIVSKLEKFRDTEPELKMFFKLPKDAEFVDAYKVGFNAAIPIIEKLYSALDEYANMPTIVIDSDVFSDPGEIGRKAIKEVEDMLDDN